MGPNAGRMNCKVHLLFVDGDDESLVIDGIVAEQPASDVPVFRGTPITVELAAPDTPWVQQSLRALLRTWAAEDRVVTIAVTIDPRHPTAAISCDDSTMKMDLLALVA